MYIHQRRQTLFKARKYQAFPPIKPNGAVAANVLETNIQAILLSTDFSNHPEWGGGQEADDYMSIDENVDEAEQHQFDLEKDENILENEDLEPCELDDLTYDEIFGTVEEVESGLKRMKKVSPEVKYPIMKITVRFYVLFLNIYPILLSSVWAGKRH